MYLFTGAKARLSAVFFCRMNHQTSQIIKYSENQTLYLAIINFMYYDFLNPDVRIVSEYYTRKGIGERRDLRNAFTKRTLKL